MKRAIADGDGFPFATWPPLEHVVERHPGIVVNSNPGLVRVNNGLAGVTGY